MKRRWTGRWPSLKTRGPGIGVSEPPDIDARAYLVDAEKEKPDALTSRFRF